MYSREVVLGGTDAGVCAYKSAVSRDGIDAIATPVTSALRPGKDRSERSHEIVDGQRHQRAVVRQREDCCVDLAIAKPCTAKPHMKDTFSELQLGLM